MISQEEMDKLLQEIREELPKASWGEGDAGAMAQAHAVDPSIGTYLGKTLDWFFVVVSFDIEPQGFPRGSRGYDGCARKGLTIVRLTRQLAEEAFTLALTSDRKRDTNNPHKE